MSAILRRQRPGSTLTIKLPDDVKARKAKVLVMYEHASSESRSPRTFGQFPGAISMSEDFDEPLPAATTG